MLLKSQDDKQLRENRIFYAAEALFNKMSKMTKQLWRRPRFVCVILAYIWHCVQM